MNLLATEYLADSIKEGLIWFAIIIGTAMIINKLISNPVITASLVKKVKAFPKWLITPQKR